MGQKAQSFVNVLRPSEDGSVQQSFIRFFDFNESVKGFTPNIYVERKFNMRFDNRPRPAGNVSVQFTKITLQYTTRDQ